MNWLHVFSYCYGTYLHIHRKIQVVDGGPPIVHSQPEQREKTKPRRNAQIIIYEGEK